MTIYKQSKGKMSENELLSAHRFMMAAETNFKIANDHLFSHCVSSITFVGR